MDYTIRTIPCAPDDEGEVVATLISAAPATPTGRAVLYLHGYVDYFFQEHVAAAFVERGYSFHALELRKYGRSLLPHQSPNFCRSVSEYFEEIDKAIALIVAGGATDLTLLAHSTGGLVGVLYAAEGDLRSAIRRIVLNSPFLDQNASPGQKALLSALALTLGKVRPYATLPIAPNVLFFDSIHTSRHGEWQYDLRLRPLQGFPVYFGWARAILLAQRRARAGLELPMPILLLHSDKSHHSNVWSDDFFHADTVLNVEHMRRDGPGLGRNVTLHEVPGGMHDLFLSRRPVRDEALAAMFAWLEKTK